MEQEKSRLPSFLQDRKKAITLAIVLFAMCGSFVVNLFISNAIIDARLINKIKQQASDGKFRITDIIPIKQRLEGSYANDYADEELIFHKDGSMEYTAGEIFVMGSYELDDDKLVIELQGSKTEFQIIEKTDYTLLLSNGETVFSFTKTE